MDPDAALRDYVTALVDHEPADVLKEKFDNLNQWLDNGGFHPNWTNYPPHIKARFARKSKTFSTKQEAQEFFDLLGSIRKFRDGLVVGWESF